MRKKDLLIVLFVAGLLGLLAYTWLAPPGARSVPALRVQTATGDYLELNNAGRPLLINFWATTCTTCLKELPDLQRLHRELGPRGLLVIGVNMYYDPPIQVMEMVKRKNIEYPIVMDLDRRVLHAFGMQSPVTPTTFLVDPQGRIVLQKMGLLNMQALQQQIEAMLPPPG